MDDIPIAAATKFQIDYVTKQLGAVFSLTELGEVKNFLGVCIVCDRLLRTIKISQTPYIEQRKPGQTLRAPEAHLL